MAGFTGSRAWLRDHPQHDPWAPLDLNDPPGWATGRKLAALRNDPLECRAILKRSGIAFAVRPPVGERQCQRADRTILAPDALGNMGFHPTAPDATCAVDVALVLWLRNGVQPAASRILGSRLSTIEHYGTHSCRRINGSAKGAWSEHATGNAIDIAGFVLSDGRRANIRDDWGAGAGKGTFLHAAHDAACGTFGTVLGPEYNAAHADHFHLDQASGRFGGGVCR